MRKIAPDMNIRYDHHYEGKLAFRPETMVNQTRQIYQRVVAQES